MKKEIAKEMNPTFFYIGDGKFIICNKHACANSDNTVDIRFFDLANCEPLLNKANLYFMQGNFGVKYSYDSRGKWFTGYLTAFTMDKDKQESHYKFLIQNPIVRILAEDDLTLKIARIVANNSGEVIRDTSKY